MNKMGGYVRKRIWHGHLGTEQKNRCEVKTRQSLIGASGQPCFHSHLVLCTVRSGHARFSISTWASFQYKYTVLSYWYGQLQC